MPLLRRLIVSAIAIVFVAALAWSRPTEVESSSLLLAPGSQPSEGARLFIAYNCADCHGPDGVGLMAPSLQDGRWRYGGSEDSVYRSIADGRPEGMPRWSRMIPADHIRTLAAYVRTLDDGKDVTTMSFLQQGGSVNRPGH
jgi:cytochrome c oxidase cbb3-type subunit 3